MRPTPIVPLPDAVPADLAVLEELRGQMTYLTPLSAEERRELRGVRIGPKTWHLLQCRVEAASKHPELLPPSFDLRRFQRNAELAGHLRVLYARLDRMRDEVGDTLLTLGSHVLPEGTVAYGHLKVAVSAQQSLHDTVGALGSRRGRKRRAALTPSLTWAGAPLATTASPTGPVLVPAPTPTLLPDGLKQDQDAA
jgi:hypothetical protein